MGAKLAGKICKKLAGKFEAVNHVLYTELTGCDNRYFQTHAYYIVFDFKSIS